MIFNFSPAVKALWKNNIQDETIFDSSRFDTRNPPIWSEINSVVRLLDVTGIYLKTNFYKYSRRHNLKRFICSSTGILVFVVCFSFIASEVLFCGVTKFVSSSVVICMVSTLSLSLLLWIVMLRKRKQFSNLIDNSGIICELIRGNIDTKLKLRTRIGCFYVFFTPILASLCCVFSIQNDDDYFYLHCYLFGHQLETTNYYYWKSIILLFFLVIESYMQLFLPNLVTILIFFLCEHLSDVIKTFVNKCKTESWCEYCSGEAKSMRMLRFYKKIKRNFDLMHDLTSLPIFIVLSQKFLTLFFTLTVILSSKKKKVLIQLIQGSFLAINALLSIILLIVAGSRIKESHSKVRSLLLEISEFRDHNGGSSRCGLLPLLKSFVEKEDMIMTAAGMIPLTKSLFLKTAAALVTYGVLIVQLESNEDS